MNRQLFSVLLLFAATMPAAAQLQISEVMYNTAADEAVWEWFEVVNSGNSTIDLDGYVFDDFENQASNAQTEANIVSVSSGGSSAVTEIPAGGVAVIYNGSRLEYNESRFRSAWNLGASVPLIGVSDFDSLNNGGDAFGIWPSFDAYTSDLANTDPSDEQLEVATFNAAAAWLDYSGESFPRATDATIEWNGTGDYQDGANWIANTEETAGIVTSVETLLPTSPLNSLDDLASPGVVEATGSASGLVITEILYNPASDEPSEWEFFELLNATGADIDFAATPYFFDDEASGPLSEPNVTAGSIADGEIAVLFRESTSLDNMRAAWGEDVNLIPVGDWSALNNSNDTVGIWADADAYADDNTGADRIFDSAIASVTFGLEDWPEEGNGQSINLVNFGGDVDDPSNWVLSSSEDGVSTGPEPVLSSDIVDHTGGDLGTPGSFGDVTAEPGGPIDPGSFNLDLNADGTIDASDAPLLCDAVDAAGITIAAALAEGGTLPGDADLNGEVQFADFLILSSNFGAVDAHYGQGDFDCNGTVEFADFLAVSSNFGQTAAASVPEPTSGVLFGFFAFGILFLRRSR